MFVRDDNDVYAVGRTVSREISHIHATGEYSAHVVLSPRDAKRVIDAGWGQLHPLAGVKANKVLRGRMLPKCYVLLYTPRDENEIAVLLEIIKASVGYMTDSEDFR